MSDLLKESIADAKAVRETALANAKTFLEESFANSMKEMFADKLKEEMAEEGTEEEGKIEEKLASSGIGGEKGNVASKQHPKTPSPAANKNTTPAGKQEFDVKLEEEASSEEGTEVTSEELDEILAELETEVTEEDNMNSFEEGDKGDEGDEEKTDESIDLDELLAELEAEDPAAPAPAPVPAPPTAQAPADQMPAAPAPAQVPSPSEGEYSEEVSTEEMAEALVAINEENESLKKQLSEALSTVKFMKGVLSETNLLNAKLLYTNKLFKQFSLNNEQKMKVVENFDLTTSVREVKLTYAIMAESFNLGGSVVKKKNTTATTITEGLASKAVASTKPSQPIVAGGNQMAERFKTLAGIKK